MKKSLLARSITLIGIVLIGFFANWLTLPAWNLRSSNPYWFILCMAVISFLIFALVEYIADDDMGHILTLICVAIIVITLVVIIVLAIISGAMCNADKYRNVINIEEGNLTDVASVSSNNISIVDLNTAEKLGDRTLANVKNSTWYDVDDEYNLISYQGKLYRISPIKYGGLFKFGKAKNDGIPGYVLVDCHTQEAKLVTLEKPMFYSPSAHFDKLLSRHLRNQYPSFVFGKSFFEIDDEGNPYWITAVKEASIGVWGGKTESRFVFTDPCTGESKIYSANELPEWVDHAFDLGYLMQVTEWNLSYVNGYWNTLFSHTGINRTAYSYKSDGFDGYTTAVTSDGKIVFFTGITPYNTAESNIGFIFASPSTGKVIYYPCSGAEESSAQTAAEGLVSNYGYKANYPTIVNVDGVLTYIMMLKDGAGLVQRYALCNVENYSIVVEAKTLEQAVTSYKALINGEDIKEVQEETDTVTGTISKITTAEIGGYTYFYFTLEGKNELYMSSITNSNRQVLLSEGTVVTVEVTTSSEDGVFMVKSIKF